MRWSCIAPVLNGNLAIRSDEASISFGLFAVVECAAHEYIHKFRTGLNGKYSFFFFVCSANAKRVTSNSINVRACLVCLISCCCCCCCCVCVWAVFVQAPQPTMLRAVVCYPLEYSTKLHTCTVHLYSLTCRAARSHHTHTPHSSLYRMHTRIRPIYTHGP